MMDGETSTRVPRPDACREPSAGATLPMLSWRDFFLRLGDGSLWLHDDQPVAARD